MWNLKTSIPIILLSLSIGVAADSGYGATCNSMQYYNARDGTKYIIANCKETSGIYNVDNEINANSCFANANGQLVGRLWWLFISFYMSLYEFHITDWFSGVDILDPVPMWI